MEDAHFVTGGAVAFVELDGGVLQDGGAEGGGWKG